MLGPAAAAEQGAGLAAEQAQEQELAELGQGPALLVPAEQEQGLGLLPELGLAEQAPAQGLPLAQELLQQEQEPGQGPLQQEQVQGRPLAQELGPRRQELAQEPELAQGPGQEQPPAPGRGPEQV